MTDLGNQLVQKWKLLNPLLEGLSENEELLTKHLNFFNSNVLWPKDWPFATMKKALDAIDSVITERKSEAQTLVKFIKCYYEETGEICSVVSLLEDTQNLSTRRFEAVKYSFTPFFISN